MREFNSLTEAKEIIYHFKNEFFTNYFDNETEANAKKADILKEYAVATLDELTLEEVINILMDMDWQYEFSSWNNDLLGNLTVFHLYYIQLNFGEGLTPDNVMLINEAMLEDIREDWGYEKLSSWYFAEKQTA